MRALLFLFKPRWRLYALVGLAVATSLLDAVSMFLLFAFGVLVTGAAQGSGSSVVLDLAADVARPLGLDILWLMGLGVLGATLLRVGVRLYLDRRAAEEALGIQNRLFLDLFRGYLDLEYESYIDRNTGDRVNVMVGETSRVATAITGYLGLMAAAVNVAVMAALLLALDWRAFAFAAFAGVLLLAAIQPLTKRGRRLAEERTLEGRRLWVAASEPLRAYRAIVSNRIVAPVQDDLARHLRGYAATLHAYYRNQRLARPVVDLGMAIFLIGSILLAFFLTSSREEALPILLLLMVGTMRIVPALGTVQQGYSVYQANVGAVDRVQEDLTFNLEHASRPHAAAPACHDPQAVVELDGVSFAYRNGHKVLDHAHLTLRRGDRIGIVGPSGAGKSTIIDLCLGLLRPTAGEVRVAREPSGGPVRMAYLPQHAVLLHASVLENIRLSASGPRDDPLAQQVLDIVGLGAGSLRPLRLDETVAEGGAMLSGGQRQRLGLARALYRRPDILLLDEPTSSLDAAAEQEFIALVQALPTDTTLLLVSHRPQPLQLCRKVVRLANGRLEPEAAG